MRRNRPFLAVALTLAVVAATAAAAAGQTLAEVSLTGPTPPGAAGFIHHTDDVLVLPDYVRLQVVANSDSEYDQDVKERVRDAVRSTLAGSVNIPQTQAEALAMLAGELRTVRAAVDLLLRSLDCPYTAEVSLGRMDFPAKSYGGTVVPPGNYAALRVTLGRGGGRNWWCVVFPPLCFVDTGGGGLATAPGSDAAPAPVGDGEGGFQVEIRSWLMEQLRKPEWRSAWSGILTYLRHVSAQ